MEKTDNCLMATYNQMLRMGLLVSGTGWIEKAVAQKNPRLPVAIAHSRLLFYDGIDKKIAGLGTLN